VHRVAGAGKQVLVATGQGLFAGADALVGTELGRSRSPSPRRDHVSNAAPREGARDPVVASDPPVLAVQRAALRYLGLEADYLRDLRRGIGRRGMLPLVSVRLGGSFDRDSTDDYDEAFLSGAKRHLRDRDWRRGRDFDANLLLTWDLGDLAYNPEAVDLSREARQLVSLRDDVLDQINQAYFERQALLSALEAPFGEGEQGEVERLKLQLRADELAAGLDGWTGGWFGQQSEGGKPRPASGD
jgi:hypothetical protein